MEKRKPIPGREPPASTAVTVVETRRSTKWEGVSYVLSHNSKILPGNRRKLSRGAYWRAHWWDPKAKRTRSKYLGKEWRELTEEDFQEG